MKKEMQLARCRWMLFTNDGKLVTENHNQGITWKKVYKQEFGNMKALCFQLLPQGGKIFAKESPFNEYWTFEEMELIAGQNVPIHLSRNICSLQRFEEKDGLKLGIWSVKCITSDSNYEYEANDFDIGYEVRNFVNKDEKQMIFRGV